MRNTFLAASLSLALVGAPLLVGCDNGPDTKAVHEKDTTTTNPNGTTTTDKQKTTVDKNGDKKTTSEHHTDTNP